MKQRIITGTIGATGFLLLLYLGGWWYTSLLFVLALLAFVEFAEMKGVGSGSFPALLGVALVGMIFAGRLNEAVGFAWSLETTDLLLAATVILSLWTVLSRNRFDVFQATWILFGALYIGYGFAGMMKTIWEPNGLALSLLVILITWFNDSGAYFVGRKWGKRKLWPEISPNKTVEGSAAGLVFGLVASLFVFGVFPALGNWVDALWKGLLIAAAGQLGDLIESAWKRSAGVKDSGSILPGHGGVLDRFDSLLFTFIVLNLTGLV
ncbi:phosphatidate cytidylyltransferase [Staphylospora marina]|uniref:phosphatidate cytidylyltransferase n=1 Tax=Staphylospora marina TaxID=2490858 RepID=UPI000F5B9E23|nr:phosphatidate cytidylyltransferase [Staphylospora marina]